MKHVLAIDEGTTGVTCLVVSEDGRVAGRAYREITQYYPQPGWVEHDADEIVRHTIDAAREAIADAGLIWHLTRGAVHVTDPTNASRTLLFDIDAMKWSSELCALFGVPMSMLPEIRPSSGRFGITDASVFSAEIPILGVAGDQQAALYGQGCWLTREGKNTYGTGGFLLMNTGAHRTGSRGRAACSSDSPEAQAGLTWRERPWRQWPTARTTCSIS